MRILYNSISTPAMNDVSVTSGDADGWISAAASRLEANAQGPNADQAVRRPDQRPVGASSKTTKPGKR